MPPLKGGYSMTAEPLGENTYKLTLDTTEASAMPDENDCAEMHRFICSMIDSLGDEQDIHIPDGRLLAEVFLRSDGSCVIFVTALEQDTAEYEPQYYSCDITGATQLFGLCRSLARLNVCCAVYCGTEPCGFRLIFTDPSPETEQICSEYGEYGEITQLFASRTAEYLTEIFPYGNIRSFSELIE